MNTIHKFILNGTSTTKLTLPVGYRVLSAGIEPRSRDILVVWVQVNTNNPRTEICHIEVYGTGWELPENPGRFIGTVVDNCGYVWHVFEQ